MEIKIKDMKRYLKDLHDDDFIIIKSNQILLPVKRETVVKPVKFADMAKEVQKFAKEAAKISGMEVPEEKEYNFDFDGLF